MNGLKSLWAWIVNHVFQVNKYKVGYALGHEAGSDELGLVVYVECAALGGVPVQICLDHEAIKAMGGWLDDEQHLIKLLKEELGYEA